MIEIDLNDMDQNIRFTTSDIKNKIMFYDNDLNFAGWFVEKLSGVWFKVFI